MIARKTRGQSVGTGPSKKSTTGAKSVRSAVAGVYRNGTLDAALNHAARGWRVFPILAVTQSGGCECGDPNCDRPGKHPAIKAWQKEATTDVKLIREWWGGRPDRGIGIATGEDSGLTVLDVDGPEGVEALGKLAAGAGMPPTPTVESRPGHLHYYFQFENGVGSKASQLGDKLDTRSDGGYVVAPPSRHATGTLYKWLTHPGKVDLAEWPEFLRPGGARAKEKRKAEHPQRVIHLTLAQAAQALEYLDPDDEERWSQVGWILGRTFRQSDEGFAVYRPWAARSRKFNAKRSWAHYYESSKARGAGDTLTIGSLIKWATDAGWEYVAEGDEGYAKFWAVRPANKFLYLPSGALWPAESVNALLPPRGRIKPALWLMQNQGVDSVVFDPALKLITPDAVAREQGVVIDAGSTLLNRYQPSTLQLGNAKDGERWAEHVRKLFPDSAEADHVICWCAHRVQRPGEKVRHALLIGGPPGVGKDTIFEAMLPALGAWNCTAIAPDQLFAPFNEHAGKVLVRINEVVDLHETNRFKFFEATKTLIAGTPDFVEINPKYGAKFYARNCAGVVMTTNHATTGVYLPADDRRHFAIETIQLWGTDKEREDYFRDFWGWLIEGEGFAHVAAYLHAEDLSKFNPNAPPPKTECFKKIVANGMTGDTWLVDALEALPEKRRKMIRGDALREICMLGSHVSPEEFSRRIGQAMSRAGYDLYPNTDRKDFRHEFKHERGQRVLTAVYVLRGTPNAELAALLSILGKPRAMDDK